mmetsp:Transcript_39253/g.63910  ORF Transcript_39253/g.63910 Transcript_39253/m.63910 type:complete len:87 (+) Transcript_39253:203-463(+)|eukprot:jgi/Bigna1/61444/fgenesh1_kg.22_\
MCTDTSLFLSPKECIFLSSFKHHSVVPSGDVSSHPVSFIWTLQSAYISMSLTKRPFNIRKCQVESAAVNQTLLFGIISSYYYLLRF